jgi:glycosyltransferase involved in cell wall biosynthesis
MKNSPIKICFISSHAYPLFNPKSNVTHGGAEIQLYFLATELAKDKQFEVSFIVGNFGQKDIEFYQNIKVIKGANLDARDNLVNKFSSVLEFNRVLYKTNPDVVFTSCAGASIGMAKFYTNIFRKKHIFRNASSIGVDGVAIKKMGFMGKVYQYGLENADLVLTQNIDDQTILLKTHKKKSVIFKNVFEVPEPQNTVKNSILWVSRFDTMKNPYLFLELAKKIPQEKFVMICPKALMFKEWKELENASKEISNLEFIEKVPFEEIQKYFDEAKVFVNTSDFEGYPNTFIQAGKGKTPILSFIVNPDNFISQYNCGYACEGDFEIMLEKLHFLLDNQEGWNSKSEAIFEYIKSQHDIGNAIPKLKIYINSLLER